MSIGSCGHLCLSGGLCVSFQPPSKPRNPEHTFNLCKVCFFVYYWRVYRRVLEAIIPRPVAYAPTKKDMFTCRRTTINEEVWWVSFPPSTIYCACVWKLLCEFITRSFPKRYSEPAFHSSFTLFLEPYVFVKRLKVVTFFSVILANRAA